ncbi:SDR family NAD(P)-dependent oxidoreductase [Brevibacterium litoralis]|uniref:SDR family NAD(P)-dependent oxidoreductase n=1 Tax=Brevibacterium litoralis TaxID=3138935 RepID=UPI0032EAC682
MSTATLRGRTVLAVGCGSPDGAVNNGLAAARALAGAGAAVCVVDRDATAVDHTLAALPATPDGRTHTGALADVTDSAAVAAAVAHCSQTLGAPDVLHHNVGIVVNGSVVDLDESAFRAALDVNVVGAFLVLKHVLPGMIAAGSGRIITVGSIGGMRWTGYDYPAYAASKAALAELTASVGLAHAHQGIRANTIAPGLIETPLVRSQVARPGQDVDALLAARHATSPTGRMGTPEDVADLAVFLAGPGSRYLNATTIPVDGGLVHSTTGTSRT